MSHSVRVGYRNSYFTRESIDTQKKREGIEKQAPTKRCFSFQPTIWIEQVNILIYEYIDWL